MTSLESGSVVPPPRYSSHEFISPFAQCSNADAAGASDDSANSTSPNCGGSNKTPNSASAASLNHTSTPSPSYPSANSWPGFGGKSRIDNIQTSSAESSKSPTAAIDSGQGRQKNVGKILVFNSKMANEAISFVQQSRYESIVAWHEANCRPSTSTVESRPVSRSGSKRKSTDVAERSPLAGGASKTAEKSPNISRPEAESGAKGAVADQVTDAAARSSADLLMLNDDVEANADNPLRRMERMTQDSLFEPPAKVSRAVSGETNQSTRRSGDQERNAKLEKMRSLEQQLMIDKARSEWDRVVHEHEVIKMSQGYPQQLAQAYPPPGMIGAPPPYQVPTTHGLPTAVHPAYRRPPFIGQIPPQGLSPVPPHNGAMMGAIPGTGMPISQSLRPSMNPPPYSMHVPQEGYVSYGYHQATFPSQNYPPSISPTTSPAYSPMYHPMNGAALTPRGYGMYAQGIRGMYPNEKILPPEMWNQQLPQPLGNIEARIPSQKIQYHPNGTVIDENLSDDLTGMNSLFG